MGPQTDPRAAGESQGGGWGVNSPQERFKSLQDPQRAPQDPRKRPKTTPKMTENDPQVPQDDKKWCETTPKTIRNTKTRLKKYYTKILANIISKNLASKAALQKSGQIIPKHMTKQYF